VHQATLVASRGVPTVACYQSPSSTVQFQPNQWETEPKSIITTFAYAGWDER
jgi:hypothetical protein